MIVPYSEVQLTRWFDVQAGEVPVRAGVYEGSVSGIPGKGGTFQHGFYYWNGDRFQCYAMSIEEAARGVGLPFRARHWRGVVAATAHAGKYPMAKGPE